MRRLNIATCVILLLTIWNAFALVLLRPERGATGAQGLPGNNATDEQVKSAVRAALHDGARLHGSAVAEVAGCVVADPRFANVLGDALHEDRLAGAVDTVFAHNRDLLAAAVAKALEDRGLAASVTAALADQLAHNEVLQQKVAGRVDARALAGLVAVAMEERLTKAADSAARKQVDDRFDDLQKAADASVRSRLDNRGFDAEVATFLKKEGALSSAIQSALTPALISEAITAERLDAALKTNANLKNLVEAQIRSEGGQQVTQGLSDLKDVVTRMCDAITSYRDSCEKKLKECKDLMEQTRALLGEAKSASDPSSKPGSREPGAPIK
jgi:hypothetical protein